MHTDQNSRARSIFRSSDLLNRRTQKGSPGCPQAESPPLWQGNKRVTTSAVETTASHRTSILDTADPAERGVMLAGIIGALPPDGMVAAIESLPGQTQRKEAISKAMETAPDRQTALQIAQSLSNPPDRITARHQLLRSYRTNQPEAVQVAMAAEFPRERDHLMERVAGWLLSSDSMRVEDSAWITSLPPEQRSELESAITRFASQMAIPIPDNVSSALNGE